MNSAKKLPSTSLEVNFKQKKYKVDYPNTGGLIDIQRNKHYFSGNSYNELSLDTTEQGMWTRFVVDMQATFAVLIPDLKKDLSVKSITELSPLDTKQLLSVYVKQVLPWLNEWQVILNADDEDEQES